MSQRQVPGGAPAGQGRPVRPKRNKRPYQKPHVRSRQPAAPQSPRSARPQPVGAQPPGPRQPGVLRRPSRWRKVWSKPENLVLIGIAGLLMIVGLCVALLVAGIALLYASDDILPGVAAAGVDLGSLSEQEAAATLIASWQQSGVLLRDGSRTWQVAPLELGVTLDAEATARAAQAWGRSDGGVLDGLRGALSGVVIDPVLAVDLATMTNYLESILFYVDIPAQNAGVQLVNGQAVASEASKGRVMNIAATVDQVRADPAGELADGELDLIMAPTYPTISDATPLVAQANALLTSSFTVNAYDPVRDEWLNWSAPPQEWAAWLSAESDELSATGLRLTLHSQGPKEFLAAHAVFGDERYIEIEQAVEQMQAALARNQTQATIRVWHDTTTYTVQAGQTLAMIAEEVGVPYPYIQAENPGINADALSVGQTITIPSKDILIPLDPIPQKRIVVSRGQQHLWAYENGQVVFDWVISTGLPTSPTALGVFQVQSHEVNAYADQWNLYMPHFMGFYHPGPNMDLLNGFHGFPTRNGYSLLWENDLGHPVTYGCVLLNLANAEALFNWAEEGVVVEVRA
ncbi:MAG: L,D-transpeptidase family protein [Anaerolineae bacterium]|nr:L,D-transpeptidase family protein [Anaerolineae bacterium]